METQADSLTREIRRLELYTDDSAKTFGVDHDLTIFLQNELHKKKSILYNIQ